ncbi:hypothetical protein ID866_10103 [Astraeus odoratus]|nr:hypothetical protein ID866_10103 [Astraeus odoratus]
MKENQHINNNGTLHHQFYSGLPDHIKDEICHIGKPCNLDNLCYLAQEIVTCYWEHKEEVQHANKSSVPATSLPTNLVVPPLIPARANLLPLPTSAPLWGMLIPHCPTSLSPAMMVTSCPMLPPQIPTLLESWARMVS